MDKGLEILAKVKRELNLPVLTDVHDEDQIAQVSPSWWMCCKPRPCCAARPTSFVRWPNRASR
jgi:2-dehydro-3-deoxyphosphooctonate aldolase (KDO 8-P synthase)